MTTPTDILTAIKDRQLALASDLHDNAVEAQDLVDKAYQDEAAAHLETLELLAKAGAAAGGTAEAWESKLAAAMRDLDIVKAERDSLRAKLADERARAHAAESEARRVASQAAEVTPTPDRTAEIAAAIGCPGLDAETLIGRLRRMRRYVDGYSEAIKLAEYTEYTEYAKGRREACCSILSAIDGYALSTDGAAPTPDRGEAPRFVVVARGEVKGRPASVWSIRSGAEMRAAIYNSNPDLFENDTNNPDLADHAEWPFAVVDTGGGK